MLKENLSEDAVNSKLNYNFKQEYDCWHNSSSLYIDVCTRGVILHVPLLILNLIYIM